MRRSLGRDALDLDTVTSFVGDGVQKLLERALPGASSAALKKARPLFDAHYEVHYCDHTRPYPGIEEVLHYFSHKMRAVLTNKTESFAALILEGMALHDRFDLIVGARPGLRKKPAPDPVWYLLEQLQVRSERALLIGDSPQDLRAGQAAGVYTCAVTYGFRPIEELRPLQPDLVIDHPMALKQHLA